MTTYSRAKRKANGVACIEVHLPLALKKALDKVVQKDGCTRSALIEDAVTGYLYDHHGVEV